MKTNRKTFAHTEIAEKVAKKFNLSWYKKGNFIHFKNDKSEIGYIELIPATKKYLYTIRSVFWEDLENFEITDTILQNISKQYEEQKIIIDSNKGGYNVVLVLEGVELYQNKLI